MEETLALEVRHVSSSYRRRSRARQEVLHDVSFTVGQGEILGLVGESGSGKSTLAKVILGMVRPDAGSASAGSGTFWSGWSCRRSA